MRKKKILFLCLTMKSKRLYPYRSSPGDLVRIRLAGCSISYSSFQMLLSLVAPTWLLVTLRSWYISIITDCTISRMICSTVLIFCLVHLDFFSSLFLSGIITSQTFVLNSMKVFLQLRFLHGFLSSLLSSLFVVSLTFLFLISLIVDDLMPLPLRSCFTMYVLQF